MATNAKSVLLKGLDKHNIPSPLPMNIEVYKENESRNVGNGFGIK